MPIHIACGYGQNLALKMLIRNGADIESQTSNGRTPLLVLMETIFGKNKTVEILVQTGAKVNVRNQDGNTPIHLASCYPRKSKQILMLMRYGGSIKIRNQDGLTPVECTLKEFAFFNFDFKMRNFKVMVYNNVILPCN